REYIDYYNNIRIQLKLNNQSPKEFRQLAIS
ncbi:IS3 family transposase, partial [Bacillus safensis]